jgi:hypothetical protein
MFPTLNSWKATVVGEFLTCTNFEMGIKLPELSGVVLSSRPNQYSMNDVSSFTRMIVNSHGSCHGRCPLSA